MANLSVTNHTNFRVNTLLSTTFLWIKCIIRLFDKILFKVFNKAVLRDVLQLFAHFADFRKVLSQKKHIK